MLFYTCLFLSIRLRESFVLSDQNPPNKCCQVDESLLLRLRKRFTVKVWHLQPLLDLSEKVWIPASLHALRKIIYRDLKPENVRGPKKGCWCGGVGNWGHAHLKVVCIQGTPKLFQENAVTVSILFGKSRFYPLASSRSFVFVLGPVRSMSTHTHMLHKWKTYVGGWARLHVLSWCFFIFENRL